MLSIDDDDGTTEYDPHEHAESLRHGIPDHFGTVWYCSGACSILVVLLFCFCLLLSVFVVNYVSALLALC